MATIITSELKKYKLAITIINAFGFCGAGK
jgi:hypothetical protein